MRRVYVIIGIVLFLLGGALLAYTETLIGTTVGVAGLGLIGYGWLRGRPERTN